MITTTDRVARWRHALIGGLYRDGDRVVEEQVSAAGDGTAVHCRIVDFLSGDPLFEVTGEPADVLAQLDATPAADRWIRLWAVEQVAERAAADGGDVPAPA